MTTNSTSGWGLCDYSRRVLLLWWKLNMLFVLFLLPLWIFQHISSGSRLCFCISFSTQNWIPFQRFFEYSLLKSSQASYLPASPAMVDQCFCVFTRSWSIVVGFVVWEVSCLRADFNASGRVCHRCVHDDVWWAWYDFALHFPYARRLHFWLEVQVIHGS